MVLLNLILRILGTPLQAYHLTPLSKCFESKIRQPIILSQAVYKIKVIA